MMRVATYQHNTSMIQQNMRLQVEINKRNEQISTGLKSVNWGGIADDSQMIIKLESDVTRTQSYIDNLRVSQEETQVYYDTVSHMIEKLDLLMANISGAISNEQLTDAELVASAQAVYDDMIAALNTQYQGRYLFSGTDTTTPPVDITDADYDTPFTLGDPADTDYYQGDNVRKSVKADNGYTITYGVNADEAAFEEALRAMDMLINTPGDDDTRDGTMDLLIASSNKMITLQHTLSLNATTMLNHQDAHEASLTQLENFTAELKQADIASVSTELANYETQLQAAFSTTAKIINLTILDYLRT